MGAIEPLLGIVQLKKATGLWLASGQVPALLFAGERRPLTMPSLGAEMFKGLLEEILPAELCAELEAGAKIETTFQSNSGAFVVRGRTEAGLRIVTLNKAVAVPVAQRPSAAVTLTENLPQVPVAAVLAPTLPPRFSQTARSERDDDLIQLLLSAASRGASDVLLSSGCAPLGRFSGSLRTLDADTLISSDDLLGFADRHMGPARRQIFDRQGSVDFALALAAVGNVAQRFRANLFQHSAGLALAVRPIWNEVPSLAALSLPATLTDVVTPPSGLVLVAGATGAGKSTTVASLLDHVSRTRACHIVTLEDPIEYLFQRRQALIHQREVGQHALTFASGLRAALRENPDILLVGEMRDAETIRLALTAAETGHLVLSTVHGSNVAMAIERILDAFSGEEKVHARHQLAGALRFVVAQALVPGQDGSRVPVLEILAATYASCALIREGRIHMLATQLETGGEHGMVPMERALADMVRAGKVSRSAALAVAPNRDSLLLLLDERPGVPRKPR